MATTSLLELIRTSTPEEQADALGELIRLRVARTKDPIPIPESISSKRLIGYFSPILNDGRSPPKPTAKELAELRKRIENREDAQDVEEVIAELRSR